MTFSEYKPLLDVIIVLAAAIGGAAVIKKTVLNPIFAQLKKFREFSAKVRKGLESVERVAKEVYPNGGSSLRDRIDSIDSRLTFMEARDNVMLDDNPTALFISDVEGQNSYVNRTYCRLLNCGKDDLERQNWKNFIAEEKLEAYEELWKPAFQYNRPISADVLFKTTDGLTKCCHVQITPLNKPEDKLRRFMGRIQINKDCTTCAKAGRPCAMKLSA